MGSRIHYLLYLHYLLHLHYLLYLPPYAILLVSPPSITTVSPVM